MDSITYAIQQIIRRGRNPKNNEGGIHNPIL